MKEFIRIILAGMVILVAHASAASEMILPAWFWQPPVDQGVEVEVGYALPYIERNSSFEEAFLDGAWRLYLNQGCRVVGERGSITTGVETVLVGNTVHCIVDSSGFAPFAERVVRLDSLMTDEIAVMLVGMGEVSFDPALRPSPDGDVFRADEGENTLISVAPPYYHSISSWLEAESVARREAAFAVAVKRRSLGQLSSSNISQTVAEETDVWMQQFSSIGRWIDPQTGSRMVKVAFIGYPLARDRYGVDDFSDLKLFCAKIFSKCDAFSEFIYYTIDPRLKDGLVSWLFSEDSTDSSNKLAVELVNVVNRVCDNLDLLTSMPGDITCILGDLVKVQDVDEDGLSTVALNRLLFEMHYREYLK